MFFLDCSGQEKVEYLRQNSECLQNMAECWQSGWVCWGEGSRALVGNNITRDGKGVLARKQERWERRLRHGIGRKKLCYKAWRKGTTGRRRMQHKEGKTGSTGREGSRKGGVSTGGKGGTCLERAKRCQGPAHAWHFFLLRATTPTMAPGALPQPRLFLSHAQAITWPTHQYQY